MKNTGVIIQARLGSTRLPKKMTKPFYEGKNILEILLAKLSSELNTKIILATTTNPIDDRIEEIGQEFGINIYRGSEIDVLERFIGAAEYYNISNIVRVCADNPFIQPKYIQNIINEINDNDFDYLSYTLTENLPVIKSHIGLFSEGTTLSTLKRINTLTNDCFYHEHVTNYIYENPSVFNIKLIDVPDFIKGRSDLRFTLDTQEDYELLQNLYAFYANSDDNIESLILHIDSHPEILSKMKKNINKNIK